MIGGIGVDIIEIERVEQAVESFGERFLQRIYAPEEIEYCRRHEGWYESLAARFSAKEAVMKAMGTGRKGVRWREIVICNDTFGRPYVLLRGGTKRRALDQGIERVEVSMSHSHRYAVANAVALHSSSFSRGGKRRSGPGDGS